MADFKVWALRGRDGKVWTYTNDMPVLFKTRKEAHEVGVQLMPGWKAVRAEVTVNSPL